MDITTNRIVNGLLKGFHGDIPPETLEKLLSQDVEIVVPSDRATFDDLWPAIWALATVLERQLFGRIYIRCGLSASLPAPSQLGSRCIFTNEPHPVSLSITIGNTAPPGGCPVLIGDAQLRSITVGTCFLGARTKPFPIECFLLAGYLGFKTLATLIPIPEYRVEYANRQLDISYDPEIFKQRISEISAFTCIGLGQLGQAFLALLFFLHNGNLGGRRLVLIDCDKFQIENGRTQILLEEHEQWLNQHKAEYLSQFVSRWGVDTTFRDNEINWQWQKEPNDPSIALVGLDKFDVRRMVLAAGFERLIEAGVGTDLLCPKISWHFVPGDKNLGRKLFPDTTITQPLTVSGSWVDELKRSPGQCGWVSFQGISATAPSLGVAAVAYALSELGHNANATAGRATIWSPCLPVLRETVVAQSV